MDFSKQYQSLPKFGQDDDDFKDYIARQIAMKDPTQGLNQSDDTSSSEGVKAFENTLASLQKPDDVPKQDSSPVMGPADELAPQPSGRDVAATQSSPPVPAPSDSDLVSQAIGKKYGFGPDLDSDALKTAQENQGRDALYASLGEAGQSIANSLGRRQDLDDPKFFQGLRAQAGQPVANIMQQRQAKLGDLSAAQTMENNDPNSPKATIMRKSLGPLAKQAGMDPAILNGMSVEDLKDFAMKPIEYAAKFKELGEAAKTRAQAMQTAQADRAAIMRQTADARVSDTQAKADSALGDKMATFEGRGENKVYAESMRRGKNIQDLISQAPGGDLNKLSLQQSKLLEKEIDGFINGGAPTVAGVAQGEVNNIAQRWAKLQEVMGNKPQPAMLGGFIQQNIPYVGDVYNTSKKYLYEHKKDLIDSYKSRLGPDAYQRHSDRLESEFGSSPQGGVPAAATGMAPGRVSVVSPNGKVGSIPASQLQDALKQGYRQQ